MASHHNEPIAIVGTGCRFPGRCNTTSKLWELLKNPSDLSQDIPPERFNIDRFYHKTGSHHGTTNVRRSYFLSEDVSQFDHKFFAIPPGEAEAIDPQHRLLLEVTYEAIESAGCTLEGLHGSNTSVFVGVMTNDYLIQQSQDADFLPIYNATGVANSNASSRISYFFDWHGPSMTIDTACSSSLVAVSEAVQALRNGTSNVAVAAGTNLLLYPFPYISESNLNMLSPTGRSRMWDADADGYARGEGIAAVVLKTLSNAIRDGDQIECVIREIGLNHDGKTTGLTMPSASAQASLIKSVYRKAGLDLRDKHNRCQFFEAHGTGTPAGDPQEAEALSRAFFDDHSHAEDDILYVGSIKTVIGHTEGTAGLAGLLKASMAVKHGVIPPNLLFNRLNPRLEPFVSHLKIPTGAQPWPTLPNGTPRRASVNSFGFGGANAHVILESYSATIDSSTESTASSSAASILSAVASETSSLSGISESDKDGDQVSFSKPSPIIPFVISAASAESLSAMLFSLQTYLEENHEISPAQLAHALVSQKSVFGRRIAFAAPSIQELQLKVENECRRIESDPDGSLGGQAPNTSSILGVFTGQGAQWATVGSMLIHSIPKAQKIAKELELSLASLPEADRPSWSLLDELLATSTSRLNEAEIAQPLVTAIQIILVDLLHEAGVQFNAVVGHSSGEIAAAYAAGYINKSDAIRISYYRGLYAKLAASASGAKGGMMAVGTSWEDARELCELEDFVGKISIAAYNSSDLVTIAGDLDAIELAKTIFDEERKFCRILKVDTAYHSHHMSPCKTPYLNALQSCQFKPIERPNGSPRWFSSVHGGEILEMTPQLAAQYWIDNMVSPVLFSQAVAECWEQCGSSFTFGLEIGPHPALQKPVLDTLQHLRSASLPYSGTLARGKNDVEAFKDTLGSLWTYAGTGSVNLQAFEEACTDVHTVIDGGLKLPLYPWHHDRRLWTESRSYKYHLNHAAPFHDLLGQLTPESTSDHWRWKNVLSVKELPWLAGHALQGQVVFPATGYIALAMEAAMQVAGSQSVSLIELQDFEILKAIAINNTAGTELSVNLTNVSEASSDLQKTIKASFAVHSAVPSKDTISMISNCCCSVRIILEENSELSSLGLPPRDIETVSTSIIDVDRFYSTLRDEAGFTYEAPFRNITNLQRRFGMSTGTIATPAVDEGATQFLFHPAVADCALQGMFATFSAPGDGSITSIRVPKSCRRISLVPSLCGSRTTEEVTFDCNLADASDEGTPGDIDLYTAGYQAKFLQFEGLTFVPLAAATKADDKCLYQESIWCVDQPDGVLVLGDRRPTAIQKRKVLDAERAAFFYLKKLHSSVDQATRATLPWYRQALLDSTEIIVQKVENGQHEYANDWLNDTHEQILEMMASYGDDADFNLTKAVGEHLPLPDVLSGDTNILEFMTENDYLGRYYREAAGFESLNESVAGLVAQLINKYPHMNFCEIGAGTGGATKPILELVGHHYASYTYTDISSGFFEAAQEKFRSHSQKMIYKTLNIENDPEIQGFTPHSYDCIIAANVLHATKSLDVTLRNVRRLLRPGGYLVLFEIIGNNVMRIATVMGGLPGWWIGHEDGRRYAPTIELEEWDAVLKRTGFSGVDTYTPMIDKVALPGSIFCSMACDEHVDTLRDPLADVQEPGSSETLVLLQGRSKAGKNILSLLEPHFNKVIVVESLDTLPEIPTKSHILSLEDCGSAAFEGISESRWINLQKLLESPLSVLWVTSRAYRDNAHAGMSIGLFRNLYHELLGTKVQILDCHDEDDVNERKIAELSLRLKKLANIHSQKEPADVLWTIEPELRLQNGRLEVARVRPHQDQNDRLNSFQRPTTRFVEARTATLDLVPKKGSYLLHETYGDQTDVMPEYVAVRVSSSFLLSIKTPAGHAFVSLGTSEKDGERLLCLSNTNSSRIVVHKSWTTPISMDVIDRQYLSLIVGGLMNQQIMREIPTTGAILAHEPDPGLASLLSKQMAAQGRTAVFTSTRPEAKLQRGKWTWLHPRCTSRTIAATIPNGVSVYLDASNDSTNSDGLAARINAAMPASCQTIKIANLVGKTSSELPNHAPESITTLLQRATAFASSQLNGVPDGVAMDMLPLRLIASATPSAFNTASLVDWFVDSTAPVLVQPIGSRTDLFSNDKTYWLAGLSGDLGRSLADYMIAHGARNVALSSRSPKADEQWVQWHRARGACVAYFTGDVTDFDSVKEIYVKITNSMPQIAGVGLGALVLCDRMFAQMSFEEFQRVTRPKVEGTINLDRIFSDSNTPPLDWFIGFSSVVATMGNPGQSNYAAANCFMKTVINRRRELGLAGSVMDISRVIGVGYVEREMKADGRLTREQKERLFTGSMTLAMSESDLHQLFAEAIVAGRPTTGLNPELITGIAPVLREKAHPNSWPSNPKFGLLVRVGEEAVIESDQRAVQIPVKKLLEEAKSPEEMAKILKECLTSKLRTVLLLSASDAISDTTALIDIGVDSLVGVEIRAWCLKEFEVDIPVMKILNGISLSEIVEEILTTMAAAEGGGQEEVPVLDAKEPVKTV